MCPASLVLLLVLKCEVLSFISSGPRKSAHCRCTAGRRERLLCSTLQGVRTHVTARADIILWISLMAWLPLIQFNSLLHINGISVLHLIHFINFNWAETIFGKFDDPGNSDNIGHCHCANAINVKKTYQFQLVATKESHASLVDSIADADTIGNIDHCQYYHCYQYSHCCQFDMDPCYISGLSHQFEVDRDMGLFCVPCQYT